MAFFLEVSQTATTIVFAKVQINPSKNGNNPNVLLGSNLALMGSKQNTCDEIGRKNGYWEILI